MAHPKRKTSKARKRKRRTHYKISSVPSTQTCDNCGGVKLMHRVCPTCGYYRGRQVISRPDFA